MLLAAHTVWQGPARTSIEVATNHSSLKSFS